MVGNFKMAYHAHLATEQAILSDFCRTCNNAVRSYKCIFTDLHIMGNVNQVVKLHSSPEYGRAQCGPVNGTIGANLNLVFNNYISNLRNFFVVILEGKTESITSDD